MEVRRWAWAIVAGAAMVAVLAVLATSFCFATRACPAPISAANPLTSVKLSYALIYGPVGAIARLGCQKFAAVVTDVWMPGADGIQVVQAIRKVDSEVPVLVITGGGPGLSIASAAALAQVWGGAQSLCEALRRA